MSREEPRPITAGALEAATWEPNRKRPCPFIVGGQVYTHLRDLVELDPETPVIWPQAGYTTVAQVWIVSAGALVDRALAKGMRS